MKKAWVLSYPLNAQRRLIWVGGCRSWSESSLGAQPHCWFCHVVAHIKMAYDFLLSDLQNYPNKIDWASQVRHLLGELGFHEVWLAQSIGDFQQFISLFKQRLNDNFIQNWNVRLNDPSRVLLYRNFNTFCYKPYLDIVKIESARQALTRLRTSSTRLEIEVGRWAKPVSIPVD